MQIQTRIILRVLFLPLERKRWLTTITLAAVAVPAVQRDKGEGEDATAIVRVVGREWWLDTRGVQVRRNAGFGLAFEESQQQELLTMWRVCERKEDSEGDCGCHSNFPSEAVT